MAALSPRADGKNADTRNYDKLYEEVLASMGEAQSPYKLAQINALEIAAWLGLGHLGEDITEWYGRPSAAELIDAFRNISEAFQVKLDTVNRPEYTYATAAEWLNITTVKLHRLVELRKISFVKMEREVRFRLEDLELYVSGCIRPAVCNLPANPLG